LVIRKDSPWKGFFDLLMLFCSCYNTFVNAYYAAFGVPSGSLQLGMDYFIEFLFLLDICFCFCQEYVDQETYSLVSDIKSIFKHYVMSSFVFDLMAVLPFEVIFRNLGDKTRILRLFKWLRVPRLAQLLNKTRFKIILSKIFELKMERQLKKGHVNASYPIVLQMMFVFCYRILSLVIIIFTLSYFWGILWYIYTHDIEDREFELTFYDFNSFDDKTDSEK
jgi:hypothetical protein